MDYTSIFIHLLQKLESIKDGKQQQQQPAKKKNVYCGVEFTDLQMEEFKEAFSGQDRWIVRWIDI